MKKGLILVDIQNEYFPGGRVELVGIDEASQKAKELLSHFRENQWPTFHIQHVSPASNAKAFIPNTEGVEIHGTVKPLPDDGVIQKHFPNSFRETNLLDEIRNAGIEQVVICGAMSHMCVDATTRAAADFGLKCIVVHDACATRNLEFKGKTILSHDVHGAFMAGLAFAYAEVVSLEEFLQGEKE